MHETIERQVSLVMNGSEFGDAHLSQFMTRELHSRLREAGLSGRPLRVYAGYDATKPDLHLGHTITMRKLRQFQDLGHDVTFLIGDFTSRIGDPSDKDSLRRFLDPEVVRENAKTYAQQAMTVLDPEKTTVRYNSEWLSHVSMAQLIEIAGNFTAQQFLARENFRLRHERGDTIRAHEFLYPLMQGYDAVFLRADVQLGATEQLFNLMAGRRLQETFGQQPQVCITYPILPGTDGVTRMSKSVGNYIGIAEPPAVMYRKIMELPATVLEKYFRLVTRWTPEAIADLMSGLASGSVTTEEARKELAWEIVESFHGVAIAREAEETYLEGKGGES